LNRAKDQPALSGVERIDPNPPIKLICKGLAQSNRLVMAPEGKFPSFFRFIVLHWQSLSLTHRQLKVGTANQRHPLYSSESSSAHFKKQE
jgi:hypothetical protein